MREDVLYVPILQTKRGEYSALSELADKVKDRIKPMLVLTQDKYEERSKGLATQLKKKWDRPIYIDLNRVDPFTINNVSSSYFVFEGLKTEGIEFTPVVDVDNQRPDIINYVRGKNISSCIRVNVDTFNAATLANLSILLPHLAEFGNSVDLLIDFSCDLKRTRQAHAHDIEQLFSQIYSSGLGQNFSKVIIAGSSIPKDLPRTEYNPFGFEPRIDWLGFLDFMTAHQANIKHPVFADYSTSHPEEAEPMPYVNPNAKIRYTISDNYMFAVGYQVNTHGFDQYFNMSAIVINSPYFLGGNFSAGDKYLEDCANQKVSCGNMETWVKVGHNHHITFVVKQIANLYGISI
ncbi:MAG: beta family protein [Pseudomonadota bacterium]|nr:beta family protein [Pseudomonadota bacterium]